MSEHERGAYTPPTEASLSFDARQPVRGASPIPFTLIISILVLLGLAAAIFVFYRSGVRQAGQPPQAVGAPVEGMKAPPPVEAQPQDPAAGLQIYKGDQPYSPGQKTVHFAPPPETPEARPQPRPPAARRGGGRLGLGGPRRRRPPRLRRRRRQSRPPPSPLPPRRLPWPRPPASPLCRSAPSRPRPSPTRAGATPPPSRRRPARARARVSRRWKRTATPCSAPR